MQVSIFSIIIMTREYNNAYGNVWVCLFMSVRETGAAGNTVFFFTRWRQRGNYILPTFLFFFGPILFLCLSLHL